MAKDKFISAAKSGFGFCGVIFGWDSELSFL
jgi:glutamine synthetase